MTFAWPHLLWLALVPLALFVWELTHRRRTAAASHPKILRAEAGTHSLRLSNLQSQISNSPRAPVRPWLCLGLLLCIAAAARPQWGRLEEPVFDQAREIIIAIDLSRSMLTPDVKPSRLDRAKLLTQSLLERLDGERVGLVVFSGTAFLQSPLSADYEILREFLPSLDPDFLPEGGTNYRALIDASLDAFASTASADRFLIVLSDGESTVEGWRERVDQLKTKNIRVLGLGVGTTAGAMIPDGSGGLVKDERGAVVLSKLEPATLQELASSTNGVYQDASNWIDLAALIEATVETGRQGEFTETNTVRLVERFQWPLALGVWLLLLSFYYEFPVRPKPREIKLTSGIRDVTAPRSTPPSPPAPPPEITIAVFCLLFASLTLSPRIRAADTSAVPETPPLARIVTRLAEASQPTARDWAEFGRETVTWGSRLQSSQQPVPEGPVRDALAAVELGSKMDPKTADWPKLREELEALLQPLQDEQQQDQQPQDQQQDEQDKPEKEDQPKQDQSQQKQDQQSDQQKDGQQSQDQSRQKDANEPQPQSENPQSDENQSAFGDMKEQPPPPPPPQETQKVGGVPEKTQGGPPPIDPSLALPLQKLDQLKNQDSPAELFKLMEGEKDQTPRTKTKDW